MSSDEARRTTDNRGSEGPVPSPGPATPGAVPSPGPATPGAVPSPGPATPGAAAGGETARKAGRGGLAIAGAKISFILFGFAQPLILPRLLGADGYGQARTVLAIVSIVNNTVVASSIQGVSRTVSSAPEGREDQAFRSVLRVHAVVAVLVSLTFALFASTIARLEKAPHVAVPLQLVSAVVLLYGLYAPLVGYLNGRRRFGTQAALDTGYAALRTLLLAGGAFVFLRAGASGVLGACAGFVLAAMVVVPVALTRTGIGAAAHDGAASGPKPRTGQVGAGEGGPSLSSYLAFLAPVAGGQILLNLLMFTDSLLLRSFLGAAPDADRLQGIYSGAQQFSLLPYQLLMSVTFVLFPMLARAQADGDRAAVRGYTMAGVRIALLLTALVTGTIAGIAPHLIRFAFPPDMWPGGDTLRILCLGIGSFSVLGVTCAALTGLGRATDAAVLTFVGVALIATGCSIFVPRAEFGLPMLIRSATATTCALTLAAIAGGVRLRTVAGGFVRPLTLVRALAALAACVLVGSRLPWLGKPATVLEAAAVGAVGLVVLIALGEVGREDLARVMAVVGKRRAGT